MSAKCQVCGAPSQMFLCNEHANKLHALLTIMPWWLDRLVETSVGQARLGDPGTTRSHRSGLERYADPKPVTDDQGLADGTLGQRRLERDLEDRKLTARLLSEGGVNARASDLYDDVQNMLGSWVRDVCERRGIWWVDPAFIGPLRANEERHAPQTAVRMALWLRDNGSALASAECAGETYLDVKRASERIERTVNRPPEPRTCGPCPTPGRHTAGPKGEDVFTPDPDARTKCGTRLEARANAIAVRCPTCKQSHDVEVLIATVINDTNYMRYTIPELVNVVLPKLKEHVPQTTLQRWYAKGELKPRGYTTSRGKTIPQFILADVRRVRTLMAAKRRA